MKKIMVWAIGVFLLAGVGVGQAATETNTVMDDVVITGNRTKQKTERVPAQITVLTADEIRKSGAQNVPDALRNLGGVVVSDLQGNGLNPRVDMGGFGETGGRHIVVVVNGRKINPIDMSAISFMSIPIENVAKIEVLHGGNSVLYGGDAMGGVINIITKDAQQGVHGNVELGAGSHDTYKESADLNVGMDRFEFNLGGTRYDTQGYRDRSEAHRTSAYGQATFFASDTLSFSLDGNFTDSNYELPGGLTKAQMDENRKQSVNPADEGESREAYYVFGMESDWGQYGNLNVDLSYRDYTRDSFMASWGNVYYSYEYSTLGFNPQYRLSLPVGNMDNALTMGMEMYKTEYDLWRGSAPVQADRTQYFHDRETMGIYVQDELFVWDSLILNLGARYEDFDTSLDSELSSTTDIDDDEYAWNLGLSYILQPGSKVYARSYRAFRFPKVDEYMTLSSGAINSDLNHEVSQGYETGVRFVGMGGKMEIDARLFLFDVEDEIVYNPATSSNENLSETRHQGGEFNIRYQMLDYVGAYAGGGYTDAEISSGNNEGKQIPLVPEFKGHAGLDFTFKCGFSYRVQYNYLGSRYAGSDNANQLEKLDSAGTVDMFASYEFKSVEFFLNATNIFNEEYYTGYNYGVWGASYYPVPKATYYGGIRYRF
ncbi:MAG: TonB-dependent receptor [Desulfobacterales bacterium]|nr:TonB-dependent receptor [Desulfobacterales bacterium]